jgi:hypothetical protein
MFMTVPSDKASGLTSLYEAAIFIEAASYMGASASENDTNQNNKIVENRVTAVTQGVFDLKTAEKARYHPYQRNTRILTTQTEKPAKIRKIVKVKDTVEECFNKLKCLFTKIKTEYEATDKTDDRSGSFNIIFGYSEKIRVTANEDRQSLKAIILDLKRLAMLELSESALAVIEDSIAKTGRVTRETFLAFPKAWAQNIAELFEIMPEIPSSKPRQVKLGL